MGRLGEPSDKGDQRRCTVMHHQPAMQKPGCRDNDQPGIHDIGKEMMTLRDPGEADKRAEADRCGDCLCASPPRRQQKAKRDQRKAERGVSRYERTIMIALICGKRCRGELL